MYLVIPNAYSNGKMIFFWIIPAIPAIRHTNNISEICTNEKHAIDSRNGRHISFLFVCIVVPSSDQLLYDCIWIVRISSCSVTLKTISIGLIIMVVRDECMPFIHTIESVRNSASGFFWQAATKTSNTPEHFLKMIATLLKTTYQIYTFVEI